MRSRAITFIALAALLVFVAGVARLLQLRLETGDVFPPYSSLRADPLGTKALYESLAALPEVSARRNMKPLAKLQPDQATLLFFLGSGIGDPEHVPLSLVEALEAVAAAGGRVVISLHPVNWSSDVPPEPEMPGFLEDWLGDEQDEGDEGDEDGEGDGGDEGDEGEATDQTSGNDIEEPAEEEAEVEWEEWVTPDPVLEEREEAKVEEDAEAGKPREDKEDEEEDEPRSPLEEETVDLAERWGLTYAFDELPDGVDADSYANATAVLETADDLPEAVSWHTSLYFDELDEAWRVLYRRDGYPVVVDRDFRLGSIAFSADSYLFSNEAMLNERRPKLLAWFVGSAGKVVFDETHLGIGETPSIMVLARRYRLHGALAVIFVLALLFVWKNAVHFVPPHEESNRRGRVSIGRDAAAGFVSLLRRSIPERDIVRVCVEEWRKTFAHQTGVQRTRRARIDAIVTEHGHKKGALSDPVAAYRAICDVVSERKGKP